MEKTTLFYKAVVRPFTLWVEISICRIIHHLYRRVICRFQHQFLLPHPDPTSKERRGNDILETFSEAVVYKMDVIIFFSPEYPGEADSDTNSYKRDSIPLPAESGRGTSWGIHTHSHSQFVVQNEALTCQAGGFGGQEGTPRQEEKQACFQHRELTQFGKFGQVMKTR